MNIAANYTFFLDNGFDIELLGAVRAQDDVLYSITQDKNTIEDGYTIFDASLILSDHDNRWRATFFVQNITDKFYASAIQSSNPNLLPNGYTHIYSRQAERTYGGAAVSLVLI